MIATTLEQVALAVGGSVPQAASDVVTSVSLDSRSVARGGLFVALPGEHQDGHDFVAAAIAAGATGVLLERLPEAQTAEDIARRAVVVDDAGAALGTLARSVLDRLRAQVVALTGSSGKTTTKDLLAHVLGSWAPTVAPPGSFNNELGLPLTVFSCDETTEFLVAEMGARGLGHIAYLCDIAPPDVALVLNVGSAHVGEFGDRDAIAQAKSEIVSALTPEGLAVLNRDDPAVWAMRELAPGRVRSFGESAEADVRIADLELDGWARPSFTLEAEGGSAHISLRLTGEHMAIDAAAAAAVATGLGMPLTDVAEALAKAEPGSRWRMEVTTTPGGVTIVNDAYNANPESMRAALKALAAMGATGRTWAVLGEMRELGDETLPAHDAIGRLAVRLDISRLVSVGEGARALHLGAAHEGSWGDESVWVPDVDAAIALLRSELRPGDVVLIKASRAGGLERVAQALMEGTGS